MKWHTEKRKINELIPHSSNPRKLTKEQEKQLISSISKFDFVEIPAINLDGIILAGHQRIKVMSILGRGSEEIDVRVPDRQLTEDEAKEYLIRSNKNTGEWDFKILETEFELSDLSDFGFSELELKPLWDKQEIIQDSPPKINEEEVISKLGEIYQLGNHLLMCGDATNKESVVKLMGNDKANLVVTDPPYNVNYQGKTKNRLKIKNDSMDSDSFYNFLLNSYKNMAMVLNSGSAIYVFHSDLETINFRTALIEAGFEVKQCCIWVKNQMVLGRQDYQWQHEPVLYGWKTDGAHCWCSDRKQTTIWNFDKPQVNSDHPTMKPIDLLCYPIRNSSKNGDIILDLFGGSGSTLIACEQIGRHCRMMELDPKYCDVIRKRFAKFRGSDDWIKFTPVINS